MATIPIHNPQSPFLGLIPGGLRVGQTIKVRAEIQGFANRLVVNLQSGAALKPRDDVMLSIDVRPQEQVIIRNSCKNLIPGPEERHGGMPVQAHQSFEIAITADPAQYRIMINNQHFCVFAYRSPLNLVRFISISGTCNISYITMDQSGQPPIHVNPSYPVHSQPIHVNPSYPVHSRPPVNVVHHHHHPPAPPPMPTPAAPPPYPGFYPGHQHPTPYTTPEKEEKTSVKVAAGVGAAVGLSVIALSKAAKGLKKRK